MVQVLKTLAVIFLLALSCTAQVLQHQNGGTDVSSPGASGNILKSNGTNWISAAPTFPSVIFSGTATMGTGAISSGACASAVTVSATGVATTDTIMATPNTDPTAVTGYGPSASGSLYIVAYPTANNVNFKVCNNTGASITPSALTLNVRVVR